MFSRAVNIDIHHVCTTSMSCKEHLHFNVAKSHCLSDLIMRSIQVPEGVFKIILNKSKTAWEFWLRNAASCGWVTRAWHAESGNYAIKRIHAGLWTGAVTQGGLEENMWWWGRHQVAWLLLDSCFHNPLQISISRDLISNSVTLLLLLSFIRMLHISMKPSESHCLRMQCCVIFLILHVCKMQFKYKLDILESLCTMPVLCPIP